MAGLIWAEKVNIADETYTPGALAVGAIFAVAAAARSYIEGVAIEDAAHANADAPKSAGIEISASLEELDDIYYTAGMAAVDALLSVVDLGSMEGLIRDTAERALRGVGGTVKDMTKDPDGDPSPAA